MSEFITKINPLVSIISSFSFGLILSPLSNGLIYLITSYIFFEILAFLTNKRYIPGLRLIYLIFSFMGFYIGRRIIGDHEPLRIYYGKDKHKRFMKK